MVSRWVAILKRTFGVRNRRSELMEVRSSKSRTARKKTDASAQQGLRVVIPSGLFLQRSFQSFVTAVAR